MSGRASAVRYARALLDVAVRESDPERIGRELETFVQLVQQHADLREVLSNPVVPAASKRRLTEQLVARLAVASPLAKLLLLLAERGRFALLPELATVYGERLMEHQQIVRAEVTTATPLGPEHEAQLQQRLVAATGRQVRMTTKVDPTLIGGLVARIGGTVYDGSVATQLTRMRERLLQQR